MSFDFWKDQSFTNQKGNSRYAELFSNFGVLKMTGYWMALKKKHQRKWQNIEGSLRTILRQKTVFFFKVYYIQTRQLQVKEKVSQTK